MSRRALLLLGLSLGLFGCAGQAREMRRAPTATAADLESGAIAKKAAPLAPHPKAALGGGKEPKPSPGEARGGLPHREIIRGTPYGKEAVTGRAPRRARLELPARLSPAREVPVGSELVAAVVAMRGDEIDPEASIALCRELKGAPLARSLFPLGLVGDLSLNQLFAHCRRARCALLMIFVDGPGRPVLIFETAGGGLLRLREGALAREPGIKGLQQRVAKLWGSE